MNKSEQQEVFDRVVKHLMDMEQPAMNEDGTCFYRKPGTDERCAIGCLITDEAYAYVTEEYGWNVEGSPVQNENINEMLRRSGINLADTDLSFLASLQQLHDTEEPYDWWYNLEIIAEDFVLDKTYLNTREPDRG